MWFESWFDTRYYHLLYGNRSDAEANIFIANLLKELNPQIQSEMLDLACGKGRHSKYLAHQGFNVVGMDLSANSIAEASKFELPNLQFKVHDMRKPFGNAQFNCIFNLFTSFGYFDEDAEDALVLNNVCQALLPGGLFIQDYFNCDLFQPHHSDIEKGGILFHIKKYISGDFIKKDIIFEADGMSHQYTEKIKYYNLKKLQDLHQTCSLKPIKIFGDYNLGEFVEGNSERIIIISQKTL